MPNPAPSPKQALVLFSLLFTGDEPMKSRLRLNKKERTSLVNAGLIELERRGLAEHVVLTDAAWDWAGKNLEFPIGKQARVSETLIAVLRHLRAFLDTRGIALSEMVRPNRSMAGNGSAHEGRPEIPTTQSTDVVARVREICMHAAGGRTGVRVRLADVRKALPDVPRAALDETLIAMQRSGGAAFYPLDNPQELHSADKRDALNIAGTPRHVLYLKG